MPATEPVDATASISAFLLLPVRSLSEFAAEIPDGTLIQLRDRSGALVLPRPGQAVFAEIACESHARVRIRDGHRPAIQPESERGCGCHTSAAISAHAAKAPL